MTPVLTQGPVLPGGGKERLAPAASPGVQPSLTDQHPILPICQGGWKNQMGFQEQFLHQYLLNNETPMRKVLPFGEAMENRLKTNREKSLQPCSAYLFSRLLGSPCISQ